MRVIRESSTYEKPCTSCGLFDLESPRSNRTGGGILSVCMACRKEQRRKVQKENLGPMTVPPCPNPEDLVVYASQPTGVSNG